MDSDTLISSLIDRIAALETRVAHLEREATTEGSLSCYIYVGEDHATLSFLSGARAVASQQLHPPFRIRGTPLASPWLLQEALQSIPNYTPLPRGQLKEIFLEFSEGTDQTILFEEAKRHLAAIGLNYLPVKLTPTRIKKKE